MPYIKQEIRDLLDDHIDKLAKIVSEHRFDRAGLVNYITAYLVNRILSQGGRCYASLNMLVGALECCKLEIYRRLAVPYENSKITENGDVFDE